MSNQFKEQGGAATMDPSRLRRWIASKFMTSMIDPEKLKQKRRKQELGRIKRGAKHVVEYFHQVDDGYSHLAAQALKALTEKYDIELECHLVSGPLGANAVEPELLVELSRYDSSKIAPHYGLSFPENLPVPSQISINLAASIYAALDGQGFVNHAKQIGDALWSSNDSALDSLAAALGRASELDLKAKIEAGNARRGDLKHYSGAMFYYAGEWYWGVDRLYHLENRLSELGGDKQVQMPLIAPRQEITSGDVRDNGSLTLEVFASLRSPYTSIAFDRAIALAKDTGVTLHVRPILPMVMRGVPATSEKGIYIFTDTAREARAASVPYRRFYDPIGEPVRRCYSLYPWACSLGKGNQLLSSFLRAAFVDGVNTNTERGLKSVVENAGLDWMDAKPLVGQDGWQQALEDNRLAMYDSGLWGAPSFRLLDSDKKPVLALWGQDRLWLVAREIQNLLTK